MVMLINSYALDIIAGIYALLSISVRIVRPVQGDVNLITPPTVQPPLYQPPAPYKVEAADAPLLYNNDPNGLVDLRLLILRVLIRSIWLILLRITWTSLLRQVLGMPQMAIRVCREVIFGVPSLYS
jgi:hypothetical protein